MSAAATHRAQEPVPAKGEGSRRRLELLQDCRELVISRLSKVIAEALDRMSEELSGLALKSREPDEQRSLLDAIAVVRQHRTEIELRFRRSFADAFERRLFDLRQEVAPAGAGELSLVDDSVLEARLALDRLVHRARGRLDPDEVLGIRARLAALLERDWFEEDRHPASPEAVFEALKDSLTEIAPQPEVQSALLDAFEPHVSANLNQVYGTVNERLISNQVLPKIRPQVAASASRERPAPGERQAALQPRAPAPAGDAAALTAGVAATGGAAASLRPAPAAGGPLSAVDEEIRSVLSQLSSGSATARASATRMLSNPDIFAVADLPIPSAEPPLLDALTHFQASAAHVPAIPADLISDLGASAREKGSPLDQLTVEIVSMVFDYIYADKRLADVIKQQLLRLQVVAIKAALIDRSFFARRQHPMRRLIERISEVAADPDAELAPGSPLVRGVEEVVESVLLGFDRDLRIFDDARERIDALVAEEAVRRAERIAQLTREAERVEAVAYARELARARVSDRLDPDTPDFVRSFLHDWWSRALAEAQVTGAGAAIGFDEGIAVAEALIWSVAPKTPDEVQRLAAMLPKLINGLTRGVRIAGAPEADRAAFFDALLKAHTRAIDAAKQTAAAARKPSNLRMQADGSIRFAPLVQAAAQAPAAPLLAEARSVRLGELSRGDSIEVDADGDGGFLAYRLAWISPAQQLFVLSRYPEGAMSLERAQLAALFDEGRARVAQAVPTLDQAIDSISASGALAAAPAQDEAIAA